MSRRREIDRHLGGLAEIREIMNAMKNLAFMESNKLARLLATQRRALASIQGAADDVLSFHGPPPGAGDGAQGLDLLVGSERGFCGDFNERLIDAWKAHGAASAGAGVIAVGSKLGARLADEPRVASRLEGPGVLEEVEAVLLRLMGTLGEWQAAQPQPQALRLRVFHHEADEPEVTITHLDPFSRRTRAAPRHGYPPRLNLDPFVFLRRLADHYLFAVLHALFYSSLMAENLRRMQHMDYAVRRIEDESRALLVKRNTLRQEEITEEIEVIMLSVDAAQ